MSQTPATTTTAPATEPQPAPVSFTEEQVVQRIEAARQEEKKKLYANIESLTQRVSQLEPESVRAKQLEAQLTEASARLDAIAKAKTESGIDITKVIEETTERTRKVVASEKEVELGELRTGLTKLQTELRQKELNSLRERLINEANGDIIASMVAGNDEETIRASAKAAREQFEAIRTRFDKGTTATAPAAASAAGLPPKAGTTSRAGSAAPSGSSLDGFARGGDYASNRAKLKAELKARYS